MASDWSDALLDGLYGVLLRRTPDGGRAYHGSILEHLGVTGISTVLQEVLHSPEFQRRMLDGLAEPIYREGRDFKHVVSLGTHCYTSFLLKYAGLKKSSYPFDWIFSSPEMIEHCLCDDFREFLDPSNFQEVLDSEKIHGHHYNKYHNTFYKTRFGVDYIFNHHNMGDALNVGYFRRCIDRFRSLMRSGDKVLLVQCAPEGEDDSSTFERTCNAIDGRSSSCAFLLVNVSKPRPRAVMPDVALQQELGRHRSYRLVPTSAWRGVSFDALIDDLAVLRVIERQGLDVERHFAPWATL